MGLTEFMLRCKKGASQFDLSDATFYFKEPFP